MLIAHLPSGYLLGRATGSRGLVMAAAILGAIAPDLDMAWFYLVDSTTHHHRFWPHIPALWLLIGAIGLPVLCLLSSKIQRAAVIFLVAVFLHLLLDSVGGGIMWLWPLSDRLMSLIEVPASQSHWILSFILHWSFLLELIIIALAAITWWRNRSSVPQRG